MFTAHMSGWSKSELMNCTARELRKWHTEAVELYNILNPDPDKK